MYSRHLDGQTAYELFSRGVGFLESGHPHQAAMVLSLAKLLEPEKPSIRRALGRALFMTGQIVRARREFAKVVQINPSDDWGHFALALACDRTGQSERARGHLKLAMAMRPGQPEYEHALHRMGAT